MLDPSIIDTMVSSGCTVEQLAAVIKSHLVAEQQKMLGRRHIAALKKRRQRAVPQCPPMSPGQTGTTKLPNEINVPVPGTNRDTQNALYIKEDRYVEPMQVKEDSKKESKEVSKKVSRPISRKSHIPNDLLCSARNISDAIKIGLAEDIIAIEWSKFHDHHLHKGTLGINWDAGWRYWCQNHMTWNKQQLVAKPLTFHQATQLHNARIIRETLFPDQNQPQRPALGRPVV